MPGSMRQRGENSWNLRVYAGRDAVTGRKISVERTVRGNKREASKVLAAMVAEVDRRPVTSARKGTVAELCREWLDFATSSFSPKTVETTRMYIEDPIVPLLGPLQVAKLTPSDLDRFYRQLLEVGRSRGPYAPATIRRVHGIIRRALSQGASTFKALPSHSEASRHRFWWVQTTAIPSWAEEIYEGVPMISASSRASSYFNLASSNRPNIVNELAQPVNAPQAFIRYPALLERG
jgi:hypothetical protein